LLRFFVRALQLVDEVCDAISHRRKVTSFFDPADVVELDHAKSYAVRPFDYEGRDQIGWVIERLRGNPTARDAAITTLMPLTDTSYVPGVSLLDFWLPDGSVELVVYAHSLDFGKRAYGNLVELACLQHLVAEELAAPVGRLVVHVKSAHVHESERGADGGLASNCANSVTKTHKGTVPRRGCGGHGRAASKA